MITLGLVAEDEAGAWAVQHVTDRHLLRVDWITETHLPDFRQWSRFDGQEWLPWKNVRGKLTELFGPNFRVSGHFDGKPGAEDALAVRKVLALLRAQPDAPQLVILARDVDGTGRSAGFAQAIAEAGPQHLPFRVVLALAQPEVEAWFLCAWTPQDDAGREVHAELRQEIGFDPVARSHELTSTSSGKRDVKRVLERLPGRGPAARAAFAALDVVELHRRGAANGLAEFVRQLGTALDDHIGGSSDPVSR